MYTRLNVILAKIETNYGEDPTPTAAANAVLTSLPDIKWPADKHERDFVKQNFSPLQHVMGARSIDIGFDVELKGSGAAGTPPECGPLLRACGLDESINAGVDVTYAPVSASFESCTIYCHIHNLLTKILGCRGTVDFVGDVGKYGILRFAMKGLYVGPIDQNIPSSVTYAAIIPPQILGATLTLGTAQIASKIEAGLKNDVKARPDVTAATGYKSVEIVGRKPSGSIDPEAVTIATKDFWTEWMGGTLQALNLVIGATAGNIITINAPKCQFNEVGFGDRVGIRTMGLPFDCKQDSGDDELTIKYT